MPTVSREIRIDARVKVGGTNPLFLVGGPCVIESEKHALFMAGEIKSICRRLRVPYIFKSSFDKANRSSIKSFRGPGIERGLQILLRIKEEMGVPVLSDVHEPGQVERAAAVLDVIQIPALLCRQTDLIVEAARSGKALNIKKGQFLSPYEMRHAVEKVLSQGNERILLTERGTFFGYGNLVLDIRSIPVMKDFGFPVIVDASHSVQRPGGEGDVSGGESGFIPTLAKAGVSVGADGVFLEVHDRPDRALSDRYNSFIINKLYGLLRSLIRIRKAVGDGEKGDEKN